MLTSSRPWAVCGNLHPPAEALRGAPQDRQVVHPGGVGHLLAVSKVDDVGFQGDCDDVGFQGDCVHGGVGGIYLPTPFSLS